MFSIRFAVSAQAELLALRPFHQRRVLAAIETHLQEEPTAETRGRKMLKGFSPDFEHLPPIWQLRVGDYRVWYDVDTAAQVVVIRRVVFKGRKRTEDIT